MSEKKPFDAALFTLQQKLQSWIDALEDCERIQRYTGVEDSDIAKIKAKMNDIRIAIRVLKDWPKWEPLIEAAGKIADRRNEVLECLNAITPSNDGRVNYIYNSVRGLLESLPEREEQ